MSTTTVIAMLLVLIGLAALTLAYRDSSVERAVARIAAVSTDR